MRSPQSKWGRHCCRPHSHRRVGVVSAVFLPASRLSFRSKTRLACDVCHRSRSVLQILPRGAVILRRAHGATFRVWLRHRCSRRHPAPAFTRFYASTQPGLCSGAPLVSAKPRLFALCGSRPQTVAFRLPFQLPKSRTKLAVFHVASTSLLSQAIRLASGQDLRHDVSRQARGQLSTRFPVHKTLSFQCLAAPSR